MKDMEQILERLAPCGLHCGKCFAFKQGDIAKNSNELMKSMGDFDAYAERFVELLDEPLFNNYPQFKEVLNYLSMPDCGGCRKESCKLFKQCGVRDCSKEKGVDFCFQCSEFPCENTGFDKNLFDRHVSINKRMIEIGIIEYYNEIKDKIRY